MDTFASVEPSRLQYPDILPNEVTHRHCQATRLRCELADARTTLALFIRHDISVAYLLAFLSDHH